MTKEWRCTEEQYTEWEGKLKHGRMDYWDAFSLKPQPLDEIMKHVIYGVRHDGDFLICFSYIATHSKLTGEFLDDVLYVTSNMFSFDGWTDDAVSWTVKQLRYGDNRDITESVIDVAKGYGGANHSDGFKAHCNRLLEDARHEKSNQVASAKASAEASIRQMQALLKTSKAYLSEPSKGLTKHFQMLDVMEDQMSVYRRNMSQYIVAKANMADICVKLTSDFRFNFPTLYEWQKHIDIGWFTARQGIHLMTEHDYQRRRTQEVDE